MRCLLLIGPFFLTACTVTPPNVYLSAPTHQVGKDSFADFYTPDELDLIVRRWANENNIPFDFADYRANVVVPHDRQTFATVWYGGGIGKKILTVDLDESGEVSSHSVAIGVCGVESSGPNHRPQLNGDAREVESEIVDEPPARAAGN